MIDPAPVSGSLRTGSERVKIPVRGDQGQCSSNVVQVPVDTAYIHLLVVNITASKLRLFEYPVALCHLDVQAAETRATVVSSTDKMQLAVVDGDRRHAVNLCDAGADDAGPQGRKGGRVGSL